MKTLLCLLALLGAASSLPALAQNDQQYISFAVMALDVDAGSRKLLEDAIAQRLRDNSYDARASYDVVPQVTGIDSTSIRSTLAAQGFRAVLVIRPLDLGKRASIETVQAYLTPDRYRTISEFVDGYRGGRFNTRAVIHVVGYIFDANQSQAIWQGVMWFDEDIHSVEESVTKITDMVEFNLNQYRPAIRRQLGLPPLSEVAAP